MAFSFFLGLVMGEFWGGRTGTDRDVVWSLVSSQVVVSWMALDEVH